MAETSPFAVRQLSFKFQLGEGSFGTGGFNTVEIPVGHWAIAQIAKLGTPAQNRANIRIWGLSLDVMNKISRIGILPQAQRKNLVTVMAGDEGGTMSLAFCGTIIDAWTDFQTDTEGVLNVNASTGAFAEMQTFAPSSFTGPTDVATIMGKLAKQMGYTLENNGVNVKVNNPYLPGTARAQALALADAAGIYLVFDDDGQKMAILPLNGFRAGAEPVLDPTLGTLIGYPTYAGPATLRVQTLYDPGLRFMGKATIQNSIIKNANGPIRIVKLTHNLDTHPNGPWFSDIIGNFVISGRDAS